MSFLHSRSSDDYRASCNVRIMGNIVEVVRGCNNRLKEFPVTRIDNEHYMINSTGEIKKYNNSKNRVGNMKSIHRSIKNLRGLINTNFTGGSRELFVTLTYNQENGVMTDLTRLYNDFNYSIRLLRRDYPGLEYINVVEPQRSGAWHCHVLMKFKTSVYIDSNKDMPLYWKHGFCSVRRLNDVDNVGAYVTAYLTDLEYEVFKSLPGEKQVDVFNYYDKYFEKTVGNKRYIKGARLVLYPVGTNIYRCSRGIKKPLSYKGDYFDVLQDLSALGKDNPDFSSVVDIKNESGETIHNLYFDSYNLRGRVKTCSLSGSVCTFPLVCKKQYQLNEGG